MADNMLSARPDFGKTFNTSMWVVGLLAAIQLFAVAWAILTRESAGLAAVKVVQLPPQTGETQPPEGTPPSPNALLSHQASRLPQRLGAGPTESQTTPDAPDPTYQESILPNTEQAPVENSTQAVITGETQGEQTENLTSPAELLKLTSPPANERTAAVLTAPGRVDSVLPEPNFSNPGNAFPQGEPPTSLAAELTNAIGSVEPIDDPLLERLVSTGEELRSSGNMPAALKALREAEEMQPNHPRILSSLAASYSQMSLEEKANRYWQRVKDLGPILGGEYFRIADRTLRGEQISSAGTTTDVFKVSEIRVNPQPPGEDGQWVSLEVEVGGDPNLRPVGTDLSVLVYFYDMVDGKRIETSTANTSQEFPTVPYDWQDRGVETIEVIYHQPVFTEEEQRELGERVYHGYVLELYYRDQLQDIASAPPELQALRVEEMEAAKQQGEETLNPNNGLGPENALFPKPAASP